jgi:hypothetical protein
MQAYEWVPRRANLARCARHFGKQLPNLGCGCGFYAVSGLHQLPTAIANVGIGVVGSVAMWGRVIEHSAGYRGAVAYPDRIRLVCARCFERGRDVVPTHLEWTGADLVDPVCADHRTQADEVRPWMGASRLEQTLLSSYAVDQLPAEALARAGFAAGPLGPIELLPAARHELRQLSRSRVGLVAIAALIVAFLVVRALGPVPAPRDPVVPVADVDRLPDVPRFADVDPRPPRVEIGPEPRPPRFRFGFVCGERLGSVVELQRCGAPAVAIIGSFTSPPEPMRGCLPQDDYTRKPRFSVCWLDLTSGGVPERLRLPGVHLWDLS